MSLDALAVAWPEHRIASHADGLLVVDKPPGLPTHGGARAGDDVVGRIAEWLGPAARIGVHSRLDVGTSGALLLVTDPRRNAEVAGAKERGAIERTYVAGVVDRGLPAAGTLEHRLVVGGGRARVVRRGGLVARTRFEVLERRAGRALVRLWPETGRTHQLRVQLAAIGAPIAGDPLYGGEPAWRLLLHAARVRASSLALDVSVAEPGDLARWVRGEAWRLAVGGALARELLDRAWLRRSLAAGCTSYRLVNDEGDGMPGLVVDRHGDFVVVEPGTPELVQRAGEVARAWCDLGALGAYVHPRTAGAGSAARGDGAAAPAAGEPAPGEFVVAEHGQRSYVELGRGLATGLFVDQRETRLLVREWCRRWLEAHDAPPRVLNLFAYTCAFGAAAALGGARTTNVDVAARALQRGRAAYAANELEPSGHRFVEADAVRFAERAGRRGERYELVVLDPPTFGRAGRATFRVADDLERLAAVCATLVVDGGRLVVVTNHRDTLRHGLRGLAARAVERAGRSAARLRDLPAPVDCPHSAFSAPAPSHAVFVDFC
ncbi:MAG: class I SAM-dependent methyltransferase [Polyangiaceae bacterium]|nr:class I SAM-dependent methyltransferase [Polyangiaceae bacterium]